MANPCHDEHGRFCSFGSTKGITNSNFSSWSGLRGITARAALADSKQSGHMGMVLKQGTEIKGIAALKSEIENLRLVTLATKEKGYGTQIMQEICRQASSAGKGVILGAAPSANGFYEKLGMTKVGIGGWKFSKEEASIFATKAL